MKAEGKNTLLLFFLSSTIQSTKGLKCLSVFLIEIIDLQYCVILRCTIEWFQYFCALESDHPVISSYLCHHTKILQCNWLILHISSPWFIYFVPGSLFTCNFLCLECTLFPSFLLDSHQFSFSSQLKLYFFIRNFSLSPFPIHPRHSLPSLWLGQLVLQHTFTVFHKSLWDIYSDYTVIINNNK